MKLRPASLGIIISLSIFLGTPPSAEAATTISNLSASCYQANRPVTLTWQAEPGSVHSYAAVWTPTSQPTSATNNYGPTLEQGLDEAVSPIVWTTPSLTVSGYSFYVESHAAAEIVLSSASSTTFDIDATPPSTPSISPGSTTETTASVAWTPATDPGCEGLRGYRVYRDGTLLTTTTETFLEDKALTPDTSYTYSVEAYDNFFTGARSATITQKTRPLFPETSTQNTTTTIKDTNIQQAIPEAVNAPPVKPLDLKPPEIAMYDTSNLPQAVSPKRLDPSESEAKPTGKPSNKSFYAGVGLLTIVGGFGVFLTVNRFAPKL